jgi:hypothetical protein
MGWAADHLLRLRGKAGPIVERRALGPIQLRGAFLEFPIDHFFLKK